MGKSILKIVFQIFGVVLFISVTSYALLAAYGYQIDLLKQNIVKTSLIDLSNTISDVKVFYDGELVADKIPYQIPNVEPGKHTIKIEKEGFLPWEKQLKTDLNIVTKISDILMMPVDFDVFKKDFNIGFSYDLSISNGKWFVFISKTDNKIYTYKLNSDGSFLIDTINIKLDDKNYKYSFAGSDHLTLTSSDHVSILNLFDKKIINVKIPDEFIGFIPTYIGTLKGFYLNDGGLYITSIGEDGKINEIRLLSEDEAFKKNGFDVYVQNTSTFIVADGNLYEYFDKNLKFIDNSIISAPFLSSYSSELIYLKEGNEIVIKDMSSDSKISIGRFLERINTISFFPDDRHVLIGTSKQLSVCGLNFENCYKIIDLNNKEKVLYSNFENQFLIVELGKLKTYTYSID